MITTGLVSLHPLDESFIERVRKVALNFLHVLLHIIEDVDFRVPAVV